MKLQAFLPLFPAVLALPCNAQTRTSASYHLAAESADRGGARSASAAYTHDGSAGGITGISSVAAPAETARHGYIGQLYEVTALQLAATPPSVNEGSTTQLSAAQLLDDNTTIVLPPASVAWSVLSGPLSGVSASGLATAAPVYQNTPATAQGLFAGMAGALNLTVVNTLPDNYAPFAGDGLPDDWQVQYFLLNPANAGPLLDPDGDGQNNRFEFIAGVIPTSAVSRFTLDIQTVPGQSAQKRLVFSPRLTDRTYTVQSVLNPSAGPWQGLTGATSSDAGNVRTVTDPNAAGLRKFYRVQIQKP